MLITTYSSCSMNDRLIINW